MKIFVSLLLVVYASGFALFVSGKSLQMDSRRSHGIESGKLSLSMSSINLQNGASSSKDSPTLKKGGEATIATSTFNLAKSIIGKSL